MVADHEARLDLGIQGLGPAEHIGRGGFADVYRAEQLSLRRTVAVKVLKAQASDPDTEVRFQRECHAIGAVSDHPHIVGVHEGGLTHNGRAYLVMEYLPGGSLLDRLERHGPMPADEVVDVGIKIGRALSVAHQAGVLHRDVKPANIMISAYGEPALGDFGIARIEGGPQTLTGLVTASFAHAAPEVLEGHRPTTASDVYSLGSTMFELLVGRAPYFNASDESVWPLMKRILSEPMPRPESVGMSPSFGRVFERATARDLVDRYANIDHFVRDLSAAATDPAGLVVHAVDPALVASRTAVVDSRLPASPGSPTPDNSPVSDMAPAPAAPPVVGGVGDVALPAPKPDLTSWPDDETRLLTEPVHPGVDAYPPNAAYADPDPGVGDGPVGYYGPAERSGRGGRVAMFGLVALLAVAGLAGGAWYLANRDNTQVLPETAVRADSAVIIQLTGAADGPLAAGASHTVTLSENPPGAAFRYVVDGQPSGEPMTELVPFVPTAGRHSVAVEITADGRSETTEAVQYYAVGQLPVAGYRANLASVPSQPERWAEAMDIYDRLVAGGHGPVEMLPSDDFANLTPGYWNIYVPGFAEDGDAAEAYCKRFDLAIPTECFASYFDPSA